jgi:mannose-6-phosphate isomerase-like protein (cupin superfamily)
MKLFNFKDMKGGWFVGDFEPCAYKTKDFEVCFKTHPKGEKWATHYHPTVTEVNLLVRGKMRFQGKILQPNTIFVVEPYEISDPEFLEDCEVVVVKLPSINDKVDVTPTQLNP